MGLENVILNEVNQTQKGIHVIYSMIYPRNPEKPIIQPIDSNMFNKKEDTSEDASIPLRRGNKACGRQRKVETVCER